MDEILSEMLSEKGQKLIILRNFKFSFHKKLAGDVERWKCVKRLCKAFIKLENGVLVEDQANHVGHAAEAEGSLLRQKISNTLKRRATECISERPAKIIRQEISKCSDGPSVTANDMDRFRKNLSAAKLRTFPKLPKSMPDLHTKFGGFQSSGHTKTSTGEEFVFLHDTVNNIIIFTTAVNLDALKSAVIIFIDGTFKSAPPQFYQIFTIFIKKNSFYIPVVYGLLPDKKVETYSLFFQAMSEFTINCEIVFVDFEQSIHSALTLTWFHIEIRGCRFHLAQSWWRRIQSLGLTIEFKNKDSIVGRILRLFFGLPLLPPDEVRDFFVEELMAIKPSDEPKLDAFFDYVLDNYISENAPFPPEMWAKFCIDEDTTTNCCESFHGKLNKEIPGSHPNIFCCCKILINMQIDTYAKLKSCNMRKPSKKNRLKREYIERCMLKLKTYEYSRFEFVKRVSFKFLPSRL